MWDNNWRTANHPSLLVPLGFVTETTMRNVSKLWGSRIYINEDLCPASQEIKKAQLSQLKQAKAEGKIAYFCHTKLIIKDR